MRLLYTALLMGLGSILIAQTNRDTAIVAYSTDQSVYPLDNDSSVFNPGVTDSNVQRLLKKYQVWRYKRPFWRRKDTMGHQIMISCHSDIRELGDSLRSTGKYYELSVVELPYAGNPIFKLDDRTKVYPNPTSSNINMEFASTPLSIDLFDMTGKLIFRDEILLSQTEYRLDISLFNCGLYSLQVVHKNGLIESHRIVIVD